MGVRSQKREDRMLAPAVERNENEILVVAGIAGTN
jgi:hypothetical protein